MDGSLELNDLLDTPPICNQSSRISAFGNEHAQLTYCIQFIYLILPSIII